MDNKQKDWFSHCFNPSLSTLIIDEMGKNWGFNYFKTYWLRIEFRTKRIKSKIGLNHFKSKNILKKTYLCYLKDFSDSSEIWSDKLKRLYNKAHRATERTEIKAISRRCRGHKEWRRCSVQISDKSFDMNALYINC